jgi:two-component system response regulator HydG
MPSLALLALSDSFADVWPALASECGLALVPLESAAAPPDSVALVSAAGVEEELERAVRQLAGGAAEIAAVGTETERHVATSAVRAGATEYFALPADYDLLRSWLAERAARLRARADRIAFAAAERRKYRFDEILGESAALQQALERAARVIPHPSVTVLITGETGTGKELVARAIHYNGARREAPFVDINCAAIPDQLLESELFGHEKGAFTSATTAKPGLFELANGGTIFLDEIGHLPLALQGKLLRALEERTVRRVGGTRALPIDVRVIAATHVDLGASVRRREFREDLYYRLDVVSVALPPLRARRDDIVPLARHFLAKFAAQYGLPAPRLTTAAETALRTRDWPGNVRELRNVMERTVLLATSELLDADAFDAPRARDAAAAEGELPFPAPMRDIAFAAATRMLDLCGGNKSEAARRLGVSRARLARMLELKSESDEETEVNDEA